MFETLTLIQTNKITPIPIILFGENYWRKLVNFEAMDDAGVISAEKLDLFTYVATAKSAWNMICDYCGWPDIY